MPKTEFAKIESIHLNPSNPRVIKDEKFEQLVKSIRDFPQMLALRPIVVNGDMMALGGNQRLKACKEAGLKEVPIIKAGDLTLEQQREFIIKDNVSFGENDWDELKLNWDLDQLVEWGLDVPEFPEPDAEDISDEIAPQYKIEVSCKDESEQEKTYNKLIVMGLDCRLLSL